MQTKLGKNCMYWLHPQHTCTRAHTVEVALSYTSFHGGPSQVPSSRVTSVSVLKVLFDEVAS